MPLTLTDDRTEIDDADTVAMTGWTSASGETLSHFTTDPDPIEGTGHIGAAISSEIGDVHHAFTAADYSDAIIYVWTLPLGTMESVANGGIALFIGDGTNQIAYHQGGADLAVFRHNEKSPSYQALAIDGANPPAGFEVISGSEASLDFTNLTQIGAEWETLSKALGGGSNCFIDRIAVAAAGVGITVTAGTSGAPGLFTEMAAADRSQGVGLFRELGVGVYSAQGPMTFGDTGTAAHWFEDGTAVVNFEDRGFSAGRYSITIEGNATGVGHFELGKKLGSGDDATGTGGVSFTAPVSQGAAFDAGNADMDAILLYGCQWTNFSTANGFSFSADATNGVNHEVMGCRFINCAQVDAGRVQMRSNTWVEYVGAEGGALLWNANIDIKNSGFQACDEGIEHPAVGTFTYDGLLFSSNTVDVHNPNNATNEIALSFAGVDGTILLNDTNNGAAQSFVVGGTNRQLSSMAAELAAVGSPTGNVTMAIYANAAGVPGTLLATSDPVAASTLGAAATINFSFNKTDEQFLMLTTVTYHSAILYSAGTSTDYVTVGVDSGGGLAGASSILNGSWVAGGVQDVPVEVRYDGIVTINATNGANPVTVLNSGTPPGATVINNSVDFTLNDIVSGSELYVEAIAGGPLPVGTAIIGPVTVTTNPLTVVLNYNGDQPFRATIANGTTAPFFKPVQFNGTIGTTGFERTIQQQLDQ